MGFCYTILIQFYGLFMDFASFFNKKADNWVNVRKNFEAEMKQKLAENPSYGWIHCASAGEFEQAIPLIRSLRDLDPDLKIAVSFFSSSGFDLYKDSKLADVFFYFPLDTPANASLTVKLLNPRFAVFIRKEIWWNTLNALKVKNIPAFLVNARLAPNRNFIYAFYLKRSYPLFTRIFDTASSGNLKLERVCESRDEAFRDEVLESFCKDGPVIIAGSSWDPEEQLLAEFYKKHKSDLPGLKLIIAPHEYDGSKAGELENLFKEKIICYTNDHREQTGTPILFLDQKGILKYAYRYASVAIIGGGFSKTVHNVAEAAVYEIPVIFGPNYQKMEEIRDMVDKGLVFPVRHANEAEGILTKMLSDHSERKKIQEKLHTYFNGQSSFAVLIAEDIIKKSRSLE